MKRVIWTLGGLCAAAAVCLVLGTLRKPSVGELAHVLEDAWADHHTVV